jgi:hypothetical protein
MQLPATATPWYRQPALLVAAGAVAGVAAVWLYRRYRPALPAPEALPALMAPEPEEGKKVTPKKKAAPRAKVAKAPFLRTEKTQPALGPLPSVPKTPKPKKNVHGAGRDVGRDGAGRPAHHQGLVDVDEVRDAHDGRRRERRRPER